MAKKPRQDVEPLPVSDEEREAYLNERENDSWAKFIMNGQPSALAEYLKSGGEIDDQVRDALIALLEDDPRGNPGGGKPFRDWKTYISVKDMLIMDKFSRSQSSDGTGAKSKPMSKRQALIRYAETTGQELRRVEYQYRRGREVSKKFQ